MTDYMFVFVFTDVPCSIGICSGVDQPKPLDLLFYFNEQTWLLNINDPWNREAQKPLLLSDLPNWISFMFRLKALNLIY